jgi:ATP-dependent helicase HrpB
VTPLPIYELEADLVARSTKGARLILVAPTGSGKSTQVPQILLRNGLLDQGQVVVLQPRRLATRLLARRVAEELKVPLGREVGYQVRLENVTGPATRIRFVTEGVLLRQMLHNPGLEGVSAILFDEFHERHLYGDITLARALELQERSRPDLRLVVMSATLDVKQLEKYLAPCHLLAAQGRAFPVEIEYAEKPGYSDSRPVWDQAADAFAAHARRGDTGDVLIFMPGAYEIQRTLEALKRRSEARGCLLLPLHGELPPRDQDAAVAAYDQPKIVVATNVAETSLTIEGVRLVIDSGLARIPRHDPWRGINTLLIEKISRAAADQRAGRAGRTAPGWCLRLWSTEEHAHRPAHEVPEIKRLDLAEVVLTLKGLGIGDLRAFRWLEPPDPRALAHAEQLLCDLGALEPARTAPPSNGAQPGGHAPSEAPPSPLSSSPTPPGPSDAALVRLHLTALGRRMLAFPVHPRYARLLIAAKEQGCVRRAALIAALTQGRDLLLRHVDRDTARFREDRLNARPTSDFFQLMRAWEYAAEHDFQLDACKRVGIHALSARQVAPLLRMFLDLAGTEPDEALTLDAEDERLRRCLLLAFSDHVARRLDQGTLRCELVHGRRGVLARESVVQDAQLLVVAEVREVGGRAGEVTTLLSLATAIEAAWLQELFSGELSAATEVFYEPATRRVVAEERLKFRELSLASRRIEPPPEDAAARLLANEVLAGRLSLPAWDHSVEQWILRLNNLARWCPEMELPPISPPDRLELIAQICHGAFSSRELKERPVKSIVKAWLGDGQQALVEQHAPERLGLSNGRRPKVTYVADGPPFIALRIQELYGVTESPRIALGRVPVTVQILAPSMRPVQVTQDLASFWREHYPRVKSELQRKYPKHEWR